MIRNVTWENGNRHYTMSVAKFAALIINQYKNIEPFVCTFDGITRSTLEWGPVILKTMNPHEIEMYNKIIGD